MKDYRVGKNGMFVTILTEKTSRRIDSRALFRCTKAIAKSSGD